MATTVFNKGDVFCCARGHGVVLDKNKVLLITGNGGRGGWQHQKVDLPPDANPSTLAGMAFEKRFALEAVQTAIA